MERECKTAGEAWKRARDGAEVITADSERLFERHFGVHNMEGLWYTRMIDMPLDLTGCLYCKTLGAYASSLR